MPNAVVMTGYGPPEVLKWTGVPLREPGEGQIRIKVKAAGISPTDLALRAGYLKAIPLPPNAVLGFEAAGTVEAVGPGVTGTSIGDDVTALMFSLGGYAEYAVASIWTRKPDTVSWIDAAALPSSAEAAAGVLRQLNVTSGETLLLFGVDRAQRADPVGDARAVADRRGSQFAGERFVVLADRADHLDLPGDRELRRDDADGSAAAKQQQGLPALDV